jgi:two-component system OmpR family response regulator
MRLLVVEDDQELADGLVASLTQSSYAVDCYPTAELAFAAATVQNYDVIVLDLGLPDGDGIDLLRRLRDRGVRSPVIIITARDQLADRIRGLDAGADDYVVKPVALSELEARIRAHLRRQHAEPFTLRFSSIDLDAVHRQASVEGKLLDCTAKEYAILEVLVRAQGRIVAKERIFDGIYDAESDTSPAAVEVHISRLRRKLAAANSNVVIRALRGLGYRLEASA